MVGQGLSTALPPPSIEGLAPRRQSGRFDEDRYGDPVGFLAAVGGGTSSDRGERGGERRRPSFHRRSRLVSGRRRNGWIRRHGGALATPPGDRCHDEHLPAAVASSFAGRTPARDDAGGRARPRHLRCRHRRRRPTRGRGLWRRPRDPRALDERESGDHSRPHARRGDELRRRVLPDRQRTHQTRDRPADANHRRRSFQCCFAPRRRPRRRLGGDLVLRSALRRSPRVDRRECGRRGADRCRVAARIPAVDWHRR